MSHRGTTSARATVIHGTMYHKILCSIYVTLIHGGCGSAPPETAAVVESSLPAVVLLVVDRPEGRGYGSGSLLDTDGRVLTNLHVVQGATSLRALLWEPDRPSWSAMDGGLSRFLFENEAQMKDARLLQGDPQLDLAVVQLSGPLGAAHPLPERDSPLKVGERVYALGHPQQSVWSFTAGVVGALPEGVIQHDAAINQGSSGGPLVDAWGRLVGVNSAKLLGGTEGIGYARPLSMARLLYDQSARPVGLDRSRPGTALLSCEHALDQSPRLADDCLVWESARPFGQRIFTGAADLLLLPSEYSQRVRAWFMDGGGEAWVAHTRASVLFHLGGEQGEPPGSTKMPQPWPDDRSRQRWAERPDVREHLEAEALALDLAREKHRKQLREVNGAAADYTQEGAAYREARKMGLQVVEEAERPELGIAWVSLRGRNVDGSVFVYSECWAPGKDGWQQPFGCSVGKEGSLPSSFPPPLLNEALLEREAALAVAQHLLRTSPP